MPASLILALSCVASSPPDPPDPFRTKSPLKLDQLGKVQLKLDPLAYRSASQGPIMPEELTPATESDYDEIDSVIERATRTHGWAPIIPQFKRSMTWQWEFTITEHLWKSACANMLMPLALLALTHWVDPSLSWWSLPPTHRLAEPFIAITNGWNYLLSLATFVVTFFVGHSHEFWRKSYTLTRSVQGQLNNIGLLCATHASRTPEGALTAGASALLEDTARNLRLLHCLFYADVCYRKTPWAGRRSAGSVRLLLSFDRSTRTAPGLERLRDRGLITDREYDTLVSNALPPARWYLIVLEWITARIAAALRTGVLTGGPGLEYQVLQKCCDLRSACMSIPDELAARMPLAYVHLTHCLVDILLLIAPFSLYCKLGCFAIPTTGLFTLFYRGLLELSKSFLDPFGNRRVSFYALSTELNIDCLMGESSAGSLVWPQGAKRLPI